MTDEVQTLGSGGLGYEESYPWPDTCPHCGSEYSEGVGVVKVRGNLSVMGNAQAMKFGAGHTNDVVDGLNNPSASTYAHITESLRSLSGLVYWDDFGEWSECWQKVERAIIKENQQ